MKMWDQEELLRCCVGQRKHKSDFGETNPIFPQAQETKTHLSAMIYFRNEANFYFRTVCGRPKQILDHDLRAPCAINYFDARSVFSVVKNSRPRAAVPC